MNIYTRYFVYATAPAVLCWHLCNFTGLKMGILYGFNTQIIFFFSQNEPSHFSGQSKYILGILRATPPTVLCHFF